MYDGNSVHIADIYMHPFARILIQLFGPAFFGALQMITLSIVISNGSMSPFRADDPFQLLLQILISIPLILFWYLMGAVVLCGIQSVIYVFLMEAAYKYGLKRRSNRMILFSTFLGFLSGLSLFALQSMPRLQDAYIVVVGALSGLLTALVIYYAEPVSD